MAPLILAQRRTTNALPPNDWSAPCRQRARQHDRYGRRSKLPRLRLHHGEKRQLLQVHELRDQLAAAAKSVAAHVARTHSCPRPLTLILLGDLTDMKSESNTSFAWAIRGMRLPWSCAKFIKSFLTRRVRNTIRFGSSTNPAKTILYPAEYFVPVRLPQTVERAVRKATA